MKVHQWSTLRKKTFTPEQIERTNRYVRREILEMNLRALRELLGKTQAQMSKELGLSQSDFSKMERRQDHLLSTLRRLVEALGGDLAVVATFGDRQIKLRGV